MQNLTTKTGKGSFTKKRVREQEITLLFFKSIFSIFGLNETGVCIKIRPVAIFFIDKVILETFY